MSGVIAGLGALFGLVVGSFLNVVAYRVPLKRSVVAPPSACPECGSQIRTRDNIPVISWLMLRGKCRDCGAKISARYPVVEAVTAALFAAAVLVVGVSWVLPAYLWFVGVTVALTLTDLDHKLIPNRILFPGIVVGAVLLGFGAFLDGAPMSFVRALLGGLAYFLALFVLALVARGGFGYGDVKLAFLLGMFTAYRSWGTLAVAGFAAFFLGGVVSVLLLAARIRSRKDAIPFGPYLVLGAYVALVAADPVLDWYLGL